MGTRGAMGFRVGGQDKIAYNHFDSYPSELGKSVLEAIRATHPKDMLKPAFTITLVEEGSTPTPEQLKLCKPYLDKTVSNQTEQDWYCLLRGAQGDPTAYTQQGLLYMVDSHEFLHDSLFCEYAYILNLDDDVLEFYKGYNKDPKAKGRYAEKTDGGDQGYYGVRLMKTWKLSTLHNALKKDAGGIEKIVKQMDKLRGRDE